MVVNLFDTHCGCSRKQSLRYFYVECNLSWMVCCAGYGSLLFFEDVSIASSSISVAKTFLLSSLGYSLSFVGLRLVLKQVCQWLCRVHDSGSFSYEPCWCLIASVARLAQQRPFSCECIQILGSSVLILSIPNSSGKQFSSHRVFMLCQHLVCQRDQWKWGFSQGAHQADRW